MATIAQTSDRDREKLRRAALNDSNAPSTREQSGGSFPFDQIVEWAGDADDPDHISFAFLRRMRRDHMFAMALHFIVMPIVRAQWYMECENARVAAFSDNLIRPIYGRLVRTILRMLWAGYSPAYKPFELIKPNWTYFKDGQAVPVWDQGPIDAMVFKPVKSLKPELCRPKWKNGKFDGIKYDRRYGLGAFMIDGQRQQEIDLVHSMWATHDQEGEDNTIYGFPRLAYGKPIHHMYWYIWSLLGRAFENNADPGPVVRYPRDDSAMLGSDGKQIRNVDIALLIGRRKRSGSTVALPSDPYTDFQDRPGSIQKWDLTYPESSTDFSALMEWLGFLEAAKLRSLWIPEQGVIEGSGGSSSRNVAENFSDQRDESQGVLMEMITDIIEQVFLKPALALNMPNFEGTVKMKVLGMGSKEDDVVRQILQLIGQEDWRNFGVDVRKLVESYGFPMLDPAEQKKIMDEAMRQAESSTTPTVEPTQGRRALVTQTGFGETQYHQLPVPIRLGGRRDGDFVSSLPSTDHFEDESVVTVARQIRVQTENYLAGTVDDFARHVVRSTVELASDGTEDSRREYANEIIDSWRNRYDRTLTFGRRYRDHLRKIYEQSGRLKLKAIGERERMPMEAADGWLSDLALGNATDLDDSLREHLHAFLERSDLSGLPKQQVAALVREEFSSWPSLRASRTARDATIATVNYAVLSAGEQADIVKVQVIGDDLGDYRKGSILDLADAVELAAPPHGSKASFRLLDCDDLKIVRQPTVDGLSARFDHETSTILLSPDLDQADETDYMLAVGEALAA